MKAAAIGLVVLLGAALLLGGAPASARAAFGFLDTWGERGSAPGQFRSLSGVAVGPSGDVFTIDRDLDRVQRFTPNGELVDTFGGSEELRFAGPEGIAVDGDGNVYVADFGFSIKKLDPEGRLLAEWPILGEFLAPWRLAVTPSGHVYAIVGDFFSRRIDRFTPEGELIDSWRSAELSNLRDIAVDARGNLWVADASGARIQRLSPDGEILASWGQPGEHDGGLNYPYDVTVAPDGDVFVSEFTGRVERVQEFTSSGDFVREFGCAGKRAGQYFEASGLATDATGRLYLADFGNGRVQVFGRGGKPPKCVFDTQSADHKRYQVVLKVACLQERCRVKARGKIKLKGARVKLRSVRKRLHEDRPKVIRLRYRSNKDLVEVKRALAFSNRSGRAAVRLRVKDAAGDTQTERVRPSLDRY